MIDQSLHQRRLGMTEAVNGLLDISDAEYIILSADQHNELILYVVAILKFIHHDFHEFFTIDIGNLTTLRL